jgi:hypothetical protein
MALRRWDRREPPQTAMLVRKKKTYLPVKAIAAVLVVDQRSCLCEKFEWIGGEVGS